MLGSATDALILKLALERGVVDAERYARVLSEVTRGETRAPRLLRALDVPAKAVTDLCGLARPDGRDASGAFLVRGDVENTLAERGLLNARRVPPDELARARGIVAEKALLGRFYGVGEILVELGLLDVLQAADLRQRVRALVATCAECHRHHLLRGKITDACTACGASIRAGEGLSAHDAWRPGSSRPSEGYRRTDSGRIEVVKPTGPAFVPSPMDDEGLGEVLDEALPALLPDMPGIDLTDEPSTVIADLVASTEMADSLILEEAVARFGNYEILTELARGGMGVVYKARRVGDKTPLALKVLIAGPKATPATIARFELEAKVARQFEHDNIVKIHKYGSHEGYRYISMEFAEGVTLAEMTNERPLAPQRAARIMARVADAVQYIHEHQVIHRDLKPENVIVGVDDQPKLVDFGLVKTESNRITKSQTTLGTPSFMPPEQVRGKNVDERSDVYALGAVLYTVATAQLAFEGENTMDLFRAIVYEPLKPPTAHNPRIEPDLETVILKAMARDHTERYASASDLAADLRRYLDGQPIVGARPTSTVEHVAPPPAAPVNTLLAAMIALLLLIVLALSIAVGVLVSRG